MAELASLADIFLTGVYERKYKSERFRLSTKPDGHIALHRAANMRGQGRRIRHAICRTNGQTVAGPPPA
jgi:hypothetical protein